MFDQLCHQALDILKRTGVRRSKTALFDVFYQMWANGYFDGYGQADPVLDTFGYNHFFPEHGNREIADMTAKWYDEQFGKRKQSGDVKMVTCGVGELLQETNKAYCFHGGKFTNGRYGLEPVGIWVPKSQVSYNQATEEVTLPVWLAQEKNYMRSN